MQRALQFSAILFITVLLAGCPSVPPPTPATRASRPAVKGAPYTIQPGDTLYSIARKHGVDWGDLLEANPSLDPRDLRIGATIIIPGAVAPPKPEATVGVPAKPGMNPGHPGPISAESRFDWPLKGQVVSRFGTPVASREGEPSYGLMIRGMPGAVVTAAKSGRVNTFTDFPLLAKVVVLEHSDGFSSLYGNLDEILVKHGTWVRQGETIGVAGASRASGGSELDFRLWMNNRFVDPFPYLPR